MNRISRSAEEIESVIREYSDMLYRICLVMLGSQQDAEDALQDTFVKYISKAPVFTGAEYQKAWLIRVAANVCKDMRRFKFRHKHMNIDRLSEFCKSEEDSGILEAVFSLPAQYRMVLFLHYVEGYDVGSIAQMADISPAAVKKRLQRGREKLKLKYTEEDFRYGKIPVKASI